MPLYRWRRTLTLFSLGILFFLSTLQAQSVSFSEAERVYLEQLGAVKMAVDPDWVPFEHVDEEGNYTGIAADLIQLITERTGIQFELVPTADWAETLQVSQRGESHIIPFLNQTPAREEWLVFTEPLFIDPNVIIIREDSPYISDLSQVSNKIVVLPYGTSIGEKIKRDYPNLSIITTERENEVFQLVSDKTADLTIRSLIMGAYTIRKEGLFNLRISGQIPEYTNYLRVGVLKEEEMLRDILNKAIKTITPQDREEIVNRHVYIVVQEPFDYRILIYSLILVGVVIFGIVFWNLNLKRMNRDRSFLLDNLPLQVWYLINNHTYGFVNEAHAQFLGKKVSDLAFKDFFEIYPKEIAETIQKNNEIVFKTGKSSVSEEFIPLNILKSISEKVTPSDQILNVIKTPIFNDKGVVEYVVCSAGNITETKQLQKRIDFKIQLQELIAGISASFVNSNVENINEKIDDMLGRCGRFLNVDRAYLFMFSEDMQLMSNTNEWCAPGIESVQDLVQNYPVNEVPMIEKTIKKREFFYVADVEALSEEFEQEKVALRMQQVKSTLCIPLVNNDAVLGYFGFDSVTKTRKLYDEILELLKILGNILTDALKKNSFEKALIEAKKEAEQANKAKGVFLANMSHEIRTPMNAVIGFSQLLEKTPLEEKQVDYVSKIIFSANLLLGIINDILDYSKIEAQRIKLERIDFKLRDTITNIANMLLVKAIEKNLALKVTLDPNLPEVVKGDSLRFGQIMTNLLNNAIKFTEKGAVYVNANLLESTEADYLIRFSVQDEGIGMTEKQRSRLFSPFGQADETVSRKYGGSGLGLVISQKYVNLMGGIIEVDSQDGVGSKFSFTIRFEKAGEKSIFTQEEDSQKTKYDDGQPINMKRLEGLEVLVVDDNSLNRQVISENLKLWGINTMTAENGEEAVNLIQQTPFDLILMDVQMPVMDGYQASENIRKHFKSEDLPIIALTAHHSKTVYDKCLAHGMNDFIIKPVDPEQLRKTLNKWGSKSGQTSRKKESEANKTEYPVEEPYQKESVSGIRTPKDFPDALYAIDLKEGLKYTGDNRELYTLILKDFIQNHSKLPYEIEEASITHDIEKALFLIHNYKSISGNLGAKEIRSRLIRMEELLKKETLSTSEQTILNTFMSEMVSESKRMIHEIKAFVLSVE